MLAVVRELAGRHSSQTLVLATHGNLLALLLHAFAPAVAFGGSEPFVRFDRSFEDRATMDTVSHPRSTIAPINSIRR